MQPLVRLLYVGTAQVLLCTAPIFATLMGCIFLKERFGLFEVASIVATIVGVTLVMKPTENFTAGGKETSTMLFDVLVALSAAIGWAGSGVLSRDLCRGMNLLVVTTWIILFTFPSTVVIGLVSPGQLTAPPDLRSALLMLTVGFVGIFVTYTYNLSFMVSALLLNNDLPSPP